MTALEIAAVTVGIFTWAVAGPVLVAGVFTGLFPQKLWQLTRKRNHG